MKHPRIASLLIFLSICFSFSNCEKIDEFPTDIQSLDFVWKGLNAYYLYQDQIDDLSDRRFNNDPELENYLRGFASPEDLFATLTIPTDISSALVSDYNTINAPTPLRSAFTTGFEFAVMRDVTRLDSVVGYGLDVLPMSYASSQPRWAPLPCGISLRPRRPPHRSFQRPRRSVQPFRHHWRRLLGWKRFR